MEFRERVTGGGGTTPKEKKKTHRCRVLKDMKVIVVLYSLGKVNK